MKVVAPDPLLREAADVLHEVVDDVVVFGASAISVALHGRPAAVTPTRDVDAGTTAPEVERVVEALEEAGLVRSTVPHEEPFTWVRNDLKVQLVRPFHPFPKGPAVTLPVNNELSQLRHHRVGVAFEDDPERLRLWCASPAALVLLKSAAFGRTRAGGEPVDRDYADVVLLFEHTLEEIAEQSAGDLALRRRIMDVAKTLRDDDAASSAAIRELVASGAFPTPREARDAVFRATTRALRTLDGPSGSAEP